MDLHEELRALSTGEKFLRYAFIDWLHVTMRERAAYWKQRGKFRAIREVDANNAFHHTHATARFMRNQIKTMHIDGVEVMAYDAKAEALEDYFSSIQAPPHKVPGIST